MEFIIEVYGHPSLLLGDSGFFSLSDMGIALPATSTFMGFYVLDEFKLSHMGICLLSTLCQDCISMGFYDFNDAIAAIFNVSAASHRCDLYMLIAQARVIAMVIRG